MVGHVLPIPRKPREGALGPGSEALDPEEAEELIRELGPQRGYVWVMAMALNMAIYSECSHQKMVIFHGYVKLPEG